MFLNVYIQPVLVMTDLIVISTKLSSALTGSPLIFYKQNPQLKKNFFFFFG